jgi:hypothetical protein
MINELELVAAGVVFYRNGLDPHGPAGTDLKGAVQERMDLVRAWLSANRRGEKTERKFGECESCRQPIPDYRSGNCLVCCCAIKKILATETETKQP